MDDKENGFCEGPKDVGILPCRAYLLTRTTPEAQLRIVILPSTALPPDVHLGPDEQTTPGFAQRQASS